MPTIYDGLEPADIPQIRSATTSYLEANEDADAARLMSEHAVPAFGSDTVLCSECGVPTPPPAQRPIAYGGPVCTECLENWYEPNDPDEDDEDSDYVSSLAGYHHVYDRSDRMPDQILSYGSNVLDYHSFRHTEQEARHIASDPNYLPLYMGVEMEVECERNRGRRDRAVRACYETLGDFTVMTSDGSLNNGFEIVSAPATLAYHKSGVWEPFWQEHNGEVPADLVSYTDRSGNPGMHIHVSRNAVGIFHMAKVAMFLHSSINEPLVSPMAGRYNSHWAQVDGRRRLADIQFAGDRGSMINFNNRNTCEFRLFRGTSQFNNLMANIEFVHSLIQFGTIASASMSQLYNPADKDHTKFGLHYLDYVNWMKQPENLSYYPYISAKMRNHGLLPQETKIKRQVTGEPIPTPTAPSFTFTEERAAA